MRLRRSSTAVADRHTVTESEAGTGSAAQTDRSTGPEGGGPAASPSAPAGPGQRLGEVLVRRGALEPGRLHEALRLQDANGARLGEVLVELGVVAEQELAAAVAEQAGLEAVDLSTGDGDGAAAAELSESLARGLTAVPLGRDEDGALVVAVANPSPAVLAELQTAVAGPLVVRVAPPAQVRRRLDVVYRTLARVAEQVEAFTATGGSEAVVRRADLDGEGDDAPVVQVVNMILTQALRDRASDVHLEPQEGRVRVRYRIDGALHEVLSLPAAMGPALASRLKIMAGMNIVERRRPQDGQIATAIDDRAVDVRVATTGTVWGEKVVLRILDTGRGVLRLPDLGMPAETHEAYSRLIRSPYGMVICAGPTGSGKTTTLYASMAEVNGVDRNITTIEDPVEYVFGSITQIQINEAAGVTFAGTLKSVLRQDPDIILVGEMRDVETAHIAVQSALTGHFVLSSLHATDSVSALYRFLDMGIEAFLVASSVIGVVGQRLVRRSCRYCRVRYTPSAEELAFYEACGGTAKEQFWAGGGCAECSGTGYSGRIGVYELLTLTDEVRQMLVRPTPSHRELRDLAISQGLRTLRTEGARLVQEDETTIAEILRSIYTV
jgi:type IV pilus assembly protein PilB